MLLTLLVGRQEEHLVCKKNWVMRCWYGYLSGMRCKWFAYGPADVTATPSSLASLKCGLFYFFWCRLAQVVLEKMPLNGCLSVSCFVVLMAKNDNAGVSWITGHIEMHVTSHRCGSQNYLFRIHFYSTFLVSLIYTGLWIKGAKDHNPLSWCLLPQKSTQNVAVFIGFLEINGKIV